MLVSAGTDQRVGLIDRLDIDSEFEFDSLDGHLLIERRTNGGSLDPQTEQVGTEILVDEIENGSVLAGNPGKSTDWCAKIAQLGRDTESVQDGKTGWLDQEAGTNRAQALGLLKDGCAMALARKQYRCGLTGCAATNNTNGELRVPFNDAT